MKIVIDIPKEHYENLAKIANAGEEPLGYWERVVMHGTPLPNGHGRLIDADVLLSDLAQLCYDESSLADNPYIENLHIDSIVDVIENTDTIIPADITIVCPNCGIEQYSDKEYCMDCGARLDGRAAGSEDKE